MDLTKIIFDLIFVIATVRSQRFFGCQTSKPRDVVFVIDGSTSVRAANFQLILEFIASLVDQLPPNSKVAAVQFAVRPITEFSFNQSSSLQNARNRILSIRYMEGATQARYALIHTKEKELVKEAGNRADVEDVLIMVTDGRSADDPWPTAYEIRAQGVTTVALGITDYVDDQQLYSIAGEPSRVFKISTFDGLDDDRLRRQIMNIVCSNGVTIPPKKQTDTTRIAPPPRVFLPPVIERKSETGVSRGFNRFNTGNTFVELPTPPTTTPTPTTSVPWWRTSTTTTKPKTTTQQWWLKATTRRTTTTTPQPTIIPWWKTIPTERPTTVQPWWLNTTTSVPWWKTTTTTAPTTAVPWWKTTTTRTPTTAVPWWKTTTTRPPTTAVPWWKTTTTVPPTTTKPWWVRTTARPPTTVPWWKTARPETTTSLPWWKTTTTQTPWWKTTTRSSNQNHVNRVVINFTNQKSKFIQDSINSVDSLKGPLINRACIGTEECSIANRLGLDTRVCVCADPYIGTTCGPKHHHEGGGHRCYNKPKRRFTYNRAGRSNGYTKECQGTELCSMVDSAGLEKRLCWCGDEAYGRTCGPYHTWGGGGSRCYNRIYSRYS